MKYKGFHTDSAPPIKPGTKVRVPKGTMLRTTHPSKDGWYENGKTRTVTAHHVINGISTPVRELLYQRDRYGDDDPTLRGVDWDEVKRIMEDATMDTYQNKMYPTVNPHVVWPGTGGYWVEADINDVEIIDD